jgi:hypothetical protein
MAKVNKLITARKALQTAITWAGVAAAAIASVPVPEDIGTSDRALVVTAIGIAGALFRAINNVRKTQKKPMRYGSASGYMLAVAGLAGLMAGCVTTTAPDGTVVQSVDLDTAWGVYERLQAERTRLEAERAAASAQERALIEAEIARVSAEIQSAWNEVLRRYE